MLRLLSVLEQQERGRTMSPLFAREVMHFKHREQNPLKQKIQAPGQIPGQKQNFMQLTTNHPESNYFNCLMIGSESWPWNSSNWDLSRFYEFTFLFGLIHFSILLRYTYIFLNIKQNKYNVRPTLAQTKYGLARVFLGGRGACEQWRCKLQGGRKEAPRKLPWLQLWGEERGLGY